MDLNLHLSNLLCFGIQEFNDMALLNPNNPFDINQSRKEFKCEKCWISSENLN